MSTVTKFDGSEARRKRLHQGKSALVIARKAKLTRQTIYNIENGKVQPRGATAAAIAKALGVELSTLYKDDES